MWGVSSKMGMGTRKNGGRLKVRTLNVAEERRKGKTRMGRDLGDWRGSRRIITTHPIIN